MSFAWWCRKSNIERLAKTYDDGDASHRAAAWRFHVTTTNMPCELCVFLGIFAVVAATPTSCDCPTGIFPRYHFIVSAMLADLLNEGSFTEVRDMNAFVTLWREEEITEGIERHCRRSDRMGWGCDDSYHRKAPLPTGRGVDVGFADRYSFCMLGATKILNLDQADLVRLGAHFFNDAYIMDQNACSSPRLVVWHGSDSEGEPAGDRFWGAVRMEVERRYELAAVSSVDKFAQACRDAIELDCLTGLKHEDNRYIDSGSMRSLPI